MCSYLNNEKTIALDNVGSIQTTPRDSMAAISLTHDIKIVCKQ